VSQYRVITGMLLYVCYCLALHLHYEQGFDITTHALACFGGAGPQFCCAIAQALGISKIKVHRMSVRIHYYVVTDTSSNWEQCCCSYVDRILR
jgi:N-methylhydantoinase A/oxoprolinase/acetone carboxylase beta subunit